MRRSKSKKYMTYLGNLSLRTMTLIFGWLKYVERYIVFLKNFAWLLPLLPIEYKWKTFSKNPQIRRIWWWLKNKKILVKIDTVRKYPYFEPDIYKIKKLIKEVLKEFNEKFSVSPIIGENYIIFSTDKMTSPIKLSFHPSIEEYVEDEDEKEYLNITMNTLGNLVFVYRESKDYSDVIDLIEKIYERIEQTYNIKPIFINNTVIATISDSFKEDWSTRRVIHEKDTIINTGSNIVMAHSERLTPLTDITKFLVKVG